MIWRMLTILYLFGILVASLFRSRHRLEVENLFLRHQLIIALRRAPHRLRLGGCDRALLVWTVRLIPSLLDLAQVVQPGGDPAVAPSPAIRDYRTHTNPVRIASSLRADMIFGKDNRRSRLNRVGWIRTLRNLTRA
jgi:hypothetical protein